MAYSKVAIENIFQLRKGRKALQTYDTQIKESKRYIQINDLRSDDDIKFAVDPKGVEVFPADICIAWDGANAGTIGYGLSGFIGSTIARLRLAEKNKYFTDYIGKYLQSKFYVLNSNTTGATIPHISKERLLSLKIPIPPLREQKRIAAILDKADNIRRKREKAIQLADEFLRSVFLDMFGDPAINPNKFPLTKLNTLFSKKKSGAKCGPFGSALKKYEYTETGVPVWTMDNIKENEFQENGCLYITNEKFDALKAYTVEKGDILISRAGTVGKMCVATPRAKNSIISTNLIRLSLDLSKIKPIYFTTLMNFFKGGVGRLKTGEDGAYTFMNTGILSELKIPLPPMPLQIKYYNIHQKIQSLKKKYITNEKKYIFRSISQRAFRGDL